MTLPVKILLFVAIACAAYYVVSKGSTTAASVTGSDTTPNQILDELADLGNNSTTSGSDTDSGTVTSNIINSGNGSPGAQSVTKGKKKSPGNPLSNQTTKSGNA